MKSKHAFVVCCAVLAALIGCVSKSEYNEKMEELQAAKQEITGLETQLKEKNAGIAEMKSSQAQMSRQLSDLQQKFEAAQNKIQQMDLESR
jgi:peptidoglycan hydrolase CwlO-like protein